MRQLGYGREDFGQDFASLRRSGCWMDPTNLGKHSHHISMICTDFIYQAVYIYTLTLYIYIYNILPGFQRSYTKSSSINEPLSIAMLKKQMVFNMEIFGIPLYNCIMTNKNITRRDFSRKYDAYIIGT